MAAAIDLRSDFDEDGLRRIARVSKDEGRSSGPSASGSGRDP